MVEGAVLQYHKYHVVDRVEASHLHPPLGSPGTSEPRAVSLGSIMRAEQAGEGQQAATSARGRTGWCASCANSCDGGWARSGEADVQDEVPEPEVEYSATGPVHDERQQDDSQDCDDHPEEEHDDTGDGIPRYSSRSSHGHQLPTAARLIRRVLDMTSHHAESGVCRSIPTRLWLTQIIRSRAARATSQEPRSARRIRRHCACSAERPRHSW
jgi:hypothetical protein